MAEQIGEMKTDFSDLDPNKLEFVFKKEPRKDFVRVDIPDGLHVFGLTKIVNDTKKKFESEELEPAFKFVFQTKDIDGGFITIKTSQTTGAKGNLFKLLNSMTNGKVPVESYAGKKGLVRFLDQDKAMATMQELMGKWFMIQVVNQPGRNDPSQTFAVAANKVAMPCPGSEAWGDCREWFKANPGKFANKNQVDKAGEALVGFENYPDAKNMDAVAKEFPYFYDLTNVAEDKRPSAIKLIQLAICKQMTPDKLKWRTANKVDQLAKYLVTTVHDDEIPF